jgi:hypothetical protein
LVQNPRSASPVQTPEFYNKKMSTRHTTRGSRAFWIALLILLPLPLGALSGFFAYQHFILGIGSEDMGYSGLIVLVWMLIWAAYLIKLAWNDVLFDLADWAGEVEPEDYSINPATGFRMNGPVFDGGGCTYGCSDDD